MTTRVLIDAGGSRSRIGIKRDGNQEFRYDAGPINPASGNGWRENLAHAVAMLRDVDGISHLEGVIGSASISPATLDRENELWHDALREISTSTDILLVNDAIPLVAQHDGDLSQIGIVLGTGSCFVAQQKGRFHRWGGVEWLASDEGGATHLGLLGLQSLARALDGRCVWSEFHTALIVAGAAQSGGELLRVVAERSHPKASLSALAPVVLRHAFEGRDENALKVVNAALYAVRGYLEWVAKMIDRPAVCRVTGGLMNNRGYLLAVESLVSEVLPGAVVEVVDDVLSLAGGMDRQLAMGATGYATRIEIQRKRGSADV